MNMAQDFKLGIYRHFKGKKYFVLGVAKHSETMEDYVVYISLYDDEKSKMWVRPLNIFTGTVEREGKTMPRFEFIGTVDP